MRNTKRIPIIIGYLIEGGLDKKITNEIEKKWNEATDQRLFQLLSNYFDEDTYNKVEDIVLKFIDKKDFYGFNWEEEDMIKGGDLPWTVRTNKEGDMLEEPQHKQLKDLSEDHLFNIFKTQALSDKYINAIIELAHLDYTDELQEVQANLREKARLNKIAWIYSIIKDDEK